MKKKSTNSEKSGSFFMRLLLLTIMLTLITPVMTYAQAVKINFAGTWTFNAEKSTLGAGGGQRMGGGDIVTKQEANLLTVERTRTNQNGETSTRTMIFTLDGKECVNTSPRGDSKSVATWSSDGKTLTIATSRTMDRNGESVTMKSTEVWTLTDAKTLSVKSARQGQDGEVITTMVYDKK